MVVLEQLGGPGDTDGRHSWILLKADVGVGQLLHLHQSDVVLISAGVEPAAVPELACELAWALACEGRGGLRTSGG